MAIVAHDLRNPLNDVILTANLLAAKRAHDPDVMKLVTRLKRAAPG